MWIAFPSGAVTYVFAALPDGLMQIDLTSGHVGAFARVPGNTPRSG